jgi:DNA-binding transcriptional ArsR family regulator
VRAPGAGDLVWQLEYAVPDIVEADLGAAAAVLAALGHPLRLEILRRLLLGARTLGELQEIEGTGTTGQVHHHLRELRAAGLVVSQRRNDYAIPAERVVPLLVMIASALGRSLAGDEGDAA